jgi:hypothetical protein
MHQPTKDQEELLNKANWDNYEHTLLSKHCLFQYTIHEVGSVLKLPCQVLWNPVGNNAENASDKEHIANFISNLPGELFWYGDITTLDQALEWIFWKDRTIDIARCFLAGTDNSTNPLLDDLENERIDKWTYKYIWLEVKLFTNWWDLVRQNELEIKDLFQKHKSWGYPFKCSRELLEEMIREDIENEFYKCFKKRYVYKSKEIKDIAFLKRKLHKDKLLPEDELLVTQKMYELIDRNVVCPIWYDRVIAVCNLLAKKGNQIAQQNFEINSQIIDSLSKMQIKRFCKKSNSYTWEKGKKYQGIKPGWKA